VGKGKDVEAGPGVAVGFDADVGTGVRVEVRFSGDGAVLPADLRASSLINEFSKIIS